MKQNQKSNSKLNQKLIFGSVLILMTIVFIVGCWCITDDSSSYNPPTQSQPTNDYASNWRNSPEGERFSLGSPNDEYKDTLLSQGAGPNNVGLPPAPAPAQTTTDYSSNWRNTPEGERISLGTATDEDKAVAVSQGADPNNVGLPPAPTPTQPTNMAQVIAQQMANAESQGLTLETVPVPSSVSNPDFVNYSGQDDDSSYTPSSNNQYVASDGSTVAGISPAAYEAYLAEKASNQTPSSQQPTNMAEVINQDTSRFERHGGQRSNTVPVPSSEQTTHN